MRFYLVADDGRGSSSAAAFSRKAAAFDREFAELSRTDETMRSLLSIPGVDVANATVIGAAIGDGPAFAKGRDFAAWLGAYSHAK